MMRPFLFVFSLGFVGACSGSGPVTPPSDMLGVSGGALAGTLSVHVVRENDLTPVAGAMVDVGGTAVLTDAHGDATLRTTGTPTLHVRASTFENETWIAVDRDHAVVGLAPPTPAQPLDGHVTGNTRDSVVSVATAITMLRVSSPQNSTGTCTAGTDPCEVRVTSETRASTVDVLLVDATSARVARQLPFISDLSFALDAPSAAQGPMLRTLQVTVPGAGDLQAVVGVPGISGNAGVALIPSLDASSTGTSAPVLEGPLSEDRLWYVVIGTTPDMHGRSMIFDRHVADDDVVHLPSAFLSVPHASRTETEVSIDVDGEADLYVVEAYSADASEHVLVRHPGSGTLTVPISIVAPRSVQVRAVDTGGVVDDLAMAEALATRVATIDL